MAAGVLKERDLCKSGKSEIADPDLDCVNLILILEKRRHDMFLEEKVLIERICPVRSKDNQ
jgi:hypothetical protein